MFKRISFSQLRETIDIYTSNEDDTIKGGIEAEYLLLIETMCKSPSCTITIGGKEGTGY